MIHARLLEELNWVARRYRRMYAWRALAFVWTAALLLGGGLFAFAWNAGWATSSTAPWFVVVALLATCLSLGLAFRSARGLRWVARKIEMQHPDLQHRLLAAVEQRPDLPDGRFGFLQETVLREALAHSHSHDWEETVPERQIRAAQLTGLTALALLALLSGAMFGYTGRHETAADLPPDLASPPELAQYEITVAPGDASIERGTSLIVTARFGGNLPDDATLVCRPAGGEPSREAMSLSLSDPMFGGRVARVERDLVYRVEYAGRATRGYRVTVFDYPRLDRADAELVFPGYTSLQPKRVDDARRLTAVEGTELTLFCHLNKPVKEAHLVDEDDVRIELTPGTDDPNVYSFTKTLAKSARYRLHLLDADGRKNRTPPEFVFNVTPNRRPDLDIAAPARDVRVSPLEELQTKASVWDDFGLRAYGISFGIAGRPPSDAVLGQTTTRNQRQPVEHLIDFEHLQAEPDQLLSYYFWAEDVGPDGNPRRTSGDIYFAEVRHFEEIFRQGDQPPSGESDQQQQGGQNEQQAQQLAELQKQIINATWTVIRREVSAAPTGRFADDVDQLHQSQQAAIDQATALGEELRDPQSKEHLAAVLDHMTEAATSLNQAAQESSPQPLQPALSAEQAAYQALLKLRAREHRVTRGRGQPSQQQSGSASGPQSRAQQQLEQLELKDSENRYETERAATSPQDQADRETRQVLNRLRELARRQGDLNQRLKELQSALEEAKTEDEREEIRRRLKRLREEQERILRDTDELQQRMERPENQERMAESRDTLEQTRENIRQATEALQQGQVSKAVADGVRAERRLEQMREEFRKEASGRFSEEVRELRDDAQELHEKETRLAQELRDLDKPQWSTGGLRDPSREEHLQGGFREQGEDLDRLLEDIRRTVEEAEETEPLLTEHLYDTLRKARQQRLDDALDATGAMLDRGFPDQARAAESQARQGIEELKEGVEKAAESVLGDEDEALRRAHQVLEDLADELNEEIRHNDPARSAPGQTADEQDSPASGEQDNTPDRPKAPGPIDLEQFLPQRDRLGGPITGEDFLDWSDRLRDVEEMIDDAELRAEAARVRDSARGIRRQLRGGSQGPKWDLVRQLVADPLDELLDRVGEELLRRHDKETLVPIDRDPVPSKYVEQVRRYYEALGRGK